MPLRNTARDDASAPAASASATCAIVLRPVSRPELAPIRIDDNLFAVGRSEAPFDSYPPGLTVDLSRRHARIFSESGEAYIADLGSKNGTTLNGADIRQKTSRLADGDELCFGQSLCYRVEVAKQSRAARRPARLVSLTLTPERDNLGLQQIVVTQFPFLISKADETFQRYKTEHPHQVNYLSRRHAHIFLKGGALFVEDLGSTNGTFVNGNRLDEHAVAIEDGAVLAFGGHHFVYKAALETQQAEADPTMTQFSPARQAAPAAREAPGDPDKTTFVEAAGSFLDIFCVDPAARPGDEVNDAEANQAADPAQPAGKSRRRGKSWLFVSELWGAFGKQERGGLKRRLKWGAGLAGVLAIIAFTLYGTGEPKREVMEMAERGEWPQAAAGAARYLERDPSDEEVRTLGTEAALKANVPSWLAAVKAGESDRAAAILGEMKTLGRNNEELQELASELEWIGEIERFSNSRGGQDAPIRIYADEERIRAILKRWNEDMQKHQRAFLRISAHVPEFKDAYAGALSRLRKLQNDGSVYLAAIERLNTAIAAELKRDQPRALEAVLKEYAEKYPRLAGLDSVREDLHRYIEIDEAARERKLGPLVSLLSNTRFATPPFQEKFRALASGDRLPSADVRRQYEVSSLAWRAGDTKTAVAELEKMTSGPWGKGATGELERKRAVAEQFGTLQKARGAKGDEDRLLSFYGSLDPDEDVYFIRAVERDVAPYKDQLAGRARDMLGQAQAQWRQYRDNGAIDGRQRLEADISSQFRTQARLLAGADESARQGMSTLRQLKTGVPSEWSSLQAEISAEAEAQRRSLQDVRSVLEPRLWKQKMALLGASDEERKPPKTAN